MEEKTVLKVALVVVIIGLGFLFLYAQELTLQPIENLDPYAVEEEVYLRGVVKRASVQDKVIFLQMEGQKVEEMDVVVFNDEEILVKEGDFVEIYGKVEEYKGKKEVIASKVVLK